MPVQANVPMHAESFVECSFFIPVHRDAALSDGTFHEETAWQWLDNELYDRFGGNTMAPGVYQGSYTDPDTQQRVSDESYRFIVALSESRIDELRSILRAACVLFAQKAIYLSVAGRVEFVTAATALP